MSDSRDLPPWLAIAGRVGASTLTVAVLVTGVGFAATGAPAQLARSLPGGTEELVVRDVTLTPPERQLVCVGPMLGFIAQDATARGFAQPTELLVGASVTTTDADSPDLFNERGVSGEEPAAPLTIHRQPASEAGVAAVSLQNLSAGTMRGMATAACLPAQFDTWIAAGSADTGRQAVLSLTNPGDVPATVDVAVYSEAGAIDAPASRGILLPPGSRRVFTLTGFAPGVSSPVIHVQASGSAVAAALHVSVTRGLDADGMAIATGQFEPATQLVIPGLFVDGSESALERRQQPGFADLAPSLRLLSPSESTTAQIRILRPGAADVTSDVRLPAGQVVDIALDELGSGLFSVVVEAETAIVGGARVSAVGEASTDVSWVSGQPVIDSVTYMAFPSGQEATLSVVAVDDAITVTISPVSSDGVSILGQTTLSIPAGRSLNQVIGSAGGGYVIETTGPAALSAVVVRDGGIGHIGTAPTPPDIPPVSVIVR